MDIIVFGDGWNPCHTFDPNEIREHHAWCLEKMGKVYDYPDKQLIRGKYSTCDIVRHPKDAYLVVKALLHIEE